jgi:hypothetical protein
MRIQTFPEMPIHISPQARALPANTLRFYIYFPRPAEAHFDRDQLLLLNEKEQVVRDPFLVLSQELWSLDGRRLTVLMEPGRIKRGLGADPTHDPALVVGRVYSLVVTALGQTARHTFRVSDPVLDRLVVSERLEDVCGNRLGEALDHDLSADGRPRAGMINFAPRRST